MPETPILTTTEAAPKVGQSPRTLEDWRTKGIGPKFVKLGRKVFYRPEDLDAWIEERAFTSTSEYPAKGPDGTGDVAGTVAE